MAAPIVSIRLNPQTLNALTEAAKAAGRTRSAPAAHLVLAGLSGAPVAVPSGGLSASVEAMFAAVEGIDVDAQREAARVLVDVAAAGGSPAVAAIKELRQIYAELERLTDRPGGRA
jgi:hypothetical protein